MKKILILLLGIIFLTACVENKSSNESQQNICETSFDDAFRLFCKSVSDKDIETLKALSATPILYFDSLTSIYKNPTIDIIPRESDGAFGVFDKGEQKIYYLLIKDGNIAKDGKVLFLKMENKCVKIWDFSKFSGSNEVVSRYNEDKRYADRVTPKKSYAKVTTSSDGVTIDKVNLWSTANEKTREIIGMCINNEVVEVIEYSDPYVKVKKENGTEGWFMEGWLKEYIQ